MCADAVVETKPEIKQGNRYLLHVIVDELFEIGSCFTSTELKLYTVYV